MGSRLLSDIEVAIVWSQLCRLRVLRRDSTLTVHNNCLLSSLSIDILLAHTTQISIPSGCCIYRDTSAFKMDAIIELSDVDKALDLSRIRYQLM